MSILRSVLAAGLLVAAAVPAVVASSVGSGDVVREALPAVCRLDPLDPAASRLDFADARFIEWRIEQAQGAPVRSRHRIRLDDGPELVIARLFPGGRLRRLSVELHELAGIDHDDLRPRLAVMLTPGCEVFETRRIDYAEDGTAESVAILDPDLAVVTSTEPLNPPVPEGTDPGGVLVAHVDSGVNYTLPEVAHRLARDADGGVIGHDYWDGDARPFDVDSSRSPFFPLHHGTATASVLLREAPGARLAPYRYPRPDMARMATLIAAAAEAGAEIVNLAMGSNDREEWQAFAEAAQDHPEMLFVVSAGNDGRDIDATPVYPAALALGNLLVVTSSDPFGRLAEGSNWGADSVDLMVPAERIDVVDHRGAAGKASGSSFAVPRIAALAARLKASHPDWNAARLKQEIVGRARPVEGTARVRHGWIPDPTDDF